MTAATATTPEALVARRLDALAPSAALSARVLAATGATWAVHSLELVVFTFTRAQMERDIGMGSVALEVLGAAAAVGALLGGPLFGLLADARGRRVALLAAMALSLLGFVLSAAARVDYQVLIARVVAGVGLGGEIPAATTLLCELAPRTRRARTVALLQAFAGVGGVLGVLLAFLAAPAIGWRALYLVLSAFVLLVAALRMALPESPRWLASVGREDEALATVTKLEHATSNRQQLAGSLQVVVIDVSSSPATTKPVDESDIKASRAAVAVLLLLWTTLAVSDFALGSFLPTMVSLTGFNVYATWLTCVLLYVAQIPGALLASLLLDRHNHSQYRSLSNSTQSPKLMGDRKLTLALFSIAASVFALGVSYLPWSASGLVVTTGVCFVLLALSGLWAALLAYTPEHFPVASRARGVGVAVACGGVGGVLGSFVVFPRVYDVWMLSMSELSWIFGGGLVFVAAVLVPRFGLSCEHVDLLDPELPTALSKFEDEGEDTEPEAEEDGGGDEQLLLVECENPVDVAVPVV